MALPQRHTVNAKVQVTGGAARIVALQSAVQLWSKTERFVGPETVIDTAKVLENYLIEGSTEDAVSDDDGE